MDDLTIIVMISSKYQCSRALAKIMLDSAKRSGEVDDLIKELKGEK